MKGHLIDCINLNQLRDYILTSRAKFVSKYRVPPKYVKVPLWLYVVLKSESNNLYAVDFQQEAEKICGLIACETPSIETLEQIEVF